VHHAEHDCQLTASNIPTAAHSVLLGCHVVPANHCHCQQDTIIFVTALTLLLGRVGSSWRKRLPQLTAGCAAENDICVQQYQSISS
jgi:hypothetical protein